MDINGLKCVPELLCFTDGTPVNDPAQWPARRAELLEILRREEFGTAPAAPAAVKGEVESTESVCCSGHAVLERIHISFETDNGLFSFPVNFFLPKADKPVPLFVLINFRPDVYDKYYPAEEITDNGFALAVIHYNDVTSDDGDFTNGLAAMYDRSKYSWGKIGMWAFAASRTLDYLLTRPEIDAANAAVIGHSRLGKTALWCAAQDERFRFGISNDSGCAGASYERGKVEGNEMVKQITTNFPYWFCERYKEWVDRADEMPFDQHFLLAAIAPRYVCVGSAQEDFWAAPVHEQASCIGASPAWELHGRPGYVGKREPAVPGDDFAAGDIGYHLRSGIHFLGRGDWLSYMAYIKKHLA
ncbi:MAG: hypothetical protein IJ412_07540 [Oscillospiraceae bacterium]|nr:hypothetical protein [Oscillospiraceae bacterium]